MERFELLRQIGRGSFGTCHVVREKTTGEILVLKMVHIPEVSKNGQKDPALPANKGFDSVSQRQALEKALNEVHLLQKLNHQNIIRYKDSFIAKRTVFQKKKPGSKANKQARSRDVRCGNRKILLGAPDDSGGDIGGDVKDSSAAFSAIGRAVESEERSIQTVQFVLGIVMEYAEKGDLAQHITKRAAKINSKHAGYFTEDAVMLIFIQLLLALHYLHSKRILHRDVKTRNVFLTENGLAKLGDLGISKQLMPDDNFAYTMVGSPFFMSPELHSMQAYDSKCDMWSLGCVLFELCCLRHAFDGTSYEQIKERVLTANRVRSARLQTPRFSTELQALVDSLLSHCPDDRPDTASILLSPFVLEHLEEICRRYPVESYPQYTHLREASARWSSSKSPRPPLVLEKRTAENDVSVGKLCMAKEVEGKDQNLPLGTKSQTAGKVATQISIISSPPRTSSNSRACCQTRKPREQGITELSSLNFVLHKKGNSDEALSAGTDGVSTAAPSHLTDPHSSPRTEEGYYCPAIQIGLSNDKRRTESCSRSGSDKHSPISSCAVRSSVASMGALSECHIWGTPSRSRIEVLRPGTGDMSAAHDSQFSLPPIIAIDQQGDLYEGLSQLEMRSKNGSNSRSDSSRARALLPRLSVQSARSEESSAALSIGAPLGTPVLRRQSSFNSVTFSRSSQPLGRSWNSPTAEDDIQIGQTGRRPPRLQGSLGAPASRERSKEADEKKEDRRLFRGLSLSSANKGSDVVGRSSKSALATASEVGDDSTTSRLQEPVAAQVTSRRESGTRYGQIIVLDAEELAKNQVSEDRQSCRTPPRPKRSPTSDQENPHQQRRRGSSYLTKVLKLQVEKSEGGASHGERRLSVAMSPGDQESTRQQEECRERNCDAQLDPVDNRSLVEVCRSPRQRYVPTSLRNANVTTKISTPCWDAEHVPLSLPSCRQVECDQEDMQTPRFCGSFTRKRNEFSPPSNSFVVGRSAPKGPPAVPWKDESSKPEKEDGEKSHRKVIRKRHLHPSPNPINAVNVARVFESSVDSSTNGHASLERHFEVQTTAGTLNTKHSSLSCTRTSSTFGQEGISNPVFRSLVSSKHGSYKATLLHRRSLSEMLSNSQCERKTVDVNERHLSASSEIYLGSLSLSQYSQNHSRVGKHQSPLNWDLQRSNERRFSLSLSIRSPCRSCPCCTTQASTVVSEENFQYSHSAPLPRYIGKRRQLVISPPIESTKITTCSENVAMLDRQVYRCCTSPRIRNQSLAWSCNLGETGRGTTTTNSPSVSFSSLLIRSPLLSTASTPLSSPFGTSASVVDSQVSNSMILSGVTDASSSQW